MIVQGHRVFPSKLSSSWSSSNSESKKKSNGKNGNFEFEEDRIAIVETNVDDATGEVIGNSIERLYSLGALDVTVTAYLGKKGRAGHTIRVVCKPGTVKEFASALVEETGSLGAKVTEFRRLIVPRKEIEVPVKIGGYSGNVKVKLAKFRRSWRVKPAVSEAQSIAESEGLPLREVLEEIDASAQAFIKRNP